MITNKTEWMGATDKDGNTFAFLYYLEINEETPTTAQIASLMLKRDEDSGKKYITISKFDKEEAKEIFGLDIEKNIIARSFYRTGADYNKDWESKDFQCPASELNNKNLFQIEIKSVSNEEWEEFNKSSNLNQQRDVVRLHHGESE